MKKNYLFIVVIALFISIFGCSKNNDENQFLHGTYKMVITQTGDIDDFQFITSLNGGNALNNGIFNEQEEDLGMNYTLTNAENKRSKYLYHTAPDGVIMIFTQIAMCKDLTKSMTTKVEVYFNNELVDTKEHTFIGEDTSPFQVSWSQINK